MNTKVAFLPVIVLVQDSKRFNAEMKMLGGLWLLSSKIWLLLCMQAIIKKLHDGISCNTPGCSRFDFSYIFPCISKNIL